MKTSLRLILCCLFSSAVACVSASNNGGAGGAQGAGTGGSQSGGAGGGNQTGTGGHLTGTGGGNQTGTGGAIGTGGQTTGTGGAVGTGGQAVGTGGATDAGTSGTGGAADAGTGFAPYVCPSGPFTGNPVPNGATPTRIPNTPIQDSFNNDANNFTNVEGPVWIGDSLYFSEMTTVDIPPARIFKIAPDGSVTVVVTNSGSNGLAVDPAGNIVSANHGVGGIVRFALPGYAPTTLISMFNGKRFNSPNDLTVRNDGTIYFTDPTYQNGANPQMATHVYRVAPGAATATIITDYTDRPNGITLSLDQQGQTPPSGAATQTLYVDGGMGVRQYAINADGTVAMTGTAFGPSDVATNTDGMVMDCAGNLYVVVAGSLNVFVVSPAGAKIGEISISGPQAVTNVAFGGTDHKTLYMTAQGAGKTQGVFKVTLNFPGMPY
jgi:gluconolactonase